MVLLLIISNKVFSPQYVVWFGPLLAVLIVKLSPESQSAQENEPVLDDQHAQVREPAQDGERAQDVLGELPRLSVIAAALTTVVFPFTYNLLFEGPHWFAALVLALRNILMVYITFLAIKLTIREGLKSRVSGGLGAVGVLKKRKTRNSSERFDPAKATFRRNQAPTQ